MPGFLIAGFGSIGRRHLRNAQTLGIDRLMLYRSGKSTLPDDEIAHLPVYHDLDEALAQQPTAVIVSNPTALHLPVALAAARAGCHLLLEKPISHTLDGVAELAAVVADKKLAVLVGFQFRFHPGLLHIKKLLDDHAIGEIVSAQAHWGEYLPDWHPWEDYHHSYSARPDLGGGVLLTLCHPFDYLRWLVGDVTAVSALAGQGGGLGIAVEDTVEVSLRFASGAVGQVHLDYIQRPPEHRLRLIGTQGTIEWDGLTGVTRLANRNASQWDSFTPPDYFERNSLFIDELRHFLACIDQGEQPRCTLDDGARCLDIVLAAKQSIIEQRLIECSAVLP